jgi:hypothetical protein
MSGLNVDTDRHFPIELTVISVIGLGLEFISIKALPIELTVISVIGLGLEFISIKALPIELAVIMSVCLIKFHVTFVYFLFLQLFSGFYNFGIITILYLVAVIFQKLEIDL